MSLDIAISTGFFYLVRKPHDGADYWQKNFFYTGLLNLQGCDYHCEKFAICADQRPSSDIQRPVL